MILDKLETVSCLFSVITTYLRALNWNPLKLTNLPFIFDSMTKVSRASVNFVSSQWQMNDFFQNCQNWSQFQSKLFEMWWLKLKIYHKFTNSCFSLSVLAKREYIADYPVKTSQEFAYIAWVCLLSSRNTMFYKKVSWLQILRH